MPKWLYKTTAPERKVRTELKKFNLEYHQNRSVHSGYNADFYLPKWNLIIEVMGCFWHRCGKCGFDKKVLTEGQIENVAKDKIKMPAFKTLYNLIVIWEHETKKRGFPKRFKKLFEEAIRDIEDGKKFFCEV